jgi:hypothetical protein
MSHLQWSSFPYFYWDLQHLALYHVAYHSLLHNHLRRLVESIGQAVNESAQEAIPA